MDAAEIRRHLVVGLVGRAGGLFTPSLSIGASLGHDVALLLAPDHATVLIALGMAGFLAAMTQTPITAMIIVMEMSTATPWCWG